MLLMAASCSGNFNQVQGVQGSADWEQGSAPCWGVEDAGCRSGHGGCRSGHSQSHSKLLVPIFQKYICHRLLRHKQRYLKNLMQCNVRKFCHFMWDESVLNLIAIICWTFDGLFDTGWENERFWRHALKNEGTEKKLRTIFQNFSEFDNPYNIYEWQGPSVQFPFMILHPDWQLGEALNGSVSVSLIWNQTFLARLRNLSTNQCLYCPTDQASASIVKSPVAGWLLVTLRLIIAMSAVNSG